MILFSSYLFFSITQESRLRIAQKQLEQQAIYSDHLEKVQKEIRTIHQRYKSIVNKLYQASLVNDTSIIKQTIHDDLLNIDQTIFHNLKQTNQLVKIEFVELKGLILTKIMTAEKQDIELFIEVPETIHFIAMETPDILCCLGILIDNAIEESANSTQQALTLVLYKEPSMITIIVKNPFKKSPNLNKIWQEGYSTKGSNRGLGLSNLRQIINHYQNVFIDTQIEQDQFVQRLMIEQ
ncbi:GHKL domain-containing protein [Enterococcus sp. LJL99]